MILCLLATAWATTTDVYDGDDLWAVLDTVGPGDEVIVHDGTWSTQQAGGSWIREYTWIGTAKNPIVIRVAPGATALLQADPAGSENGLNLAGEHFSFSGFEIANGSHGIRLSSSAHITLADLHIHDTADVGLSANIPKHTYEDITIRGTHIHHTSGTGECMYLGCNDDACQMWDSLIEYNWCHDTLAASQGDGIELKTGSYNTVVRHNVIHDVKYPGITMYDARGRGDNLVEGNVIWNAGDNGIQVVNDVVVRNNIVINSGNNGIQVKASQGGTPHGLLIAHNTVDGAGDACFRGNDFSNGTDGTVVNNVFHCPGANGIRLPAGVGGVSFTTNAVDGTDEAGGGLPVDPSAWIGGMDYYPSVGSGLTDAGTAEPSVTDDFNCLPRMGDPDIGAYAVSTKANPGWFPVAGFKTCAAGTTPGTGTGTGGTGTGGTTPGGTTTGGTATGGGTGTGTADTGPSGVTGDKGCSCSAAGSGAPGWLVLPWLVLAARRQPRRRP